LGALILSFGFYVFAYVIFYLFVPGASLFRQQERLAFVVSFALAILAGYGLYDLLSGLNLKRARKLYALLPAGAAITLALLLAFFVAAAQNPEGRLVFLGDRAGLMLIQFGLASLLMGLYLWRGINPRLFGTLAVALILFDLWSVSEPANKGRVEDRFADVAFADTLQADRDVFRVAAEERLLPGHFGIPLELEEIGGISPLRLARYDALLNLPTEISYALLNVKYVIARESHTGMGPPAARDGDAQLWRRAPSPPRAWLVGNARVIADDADAAGALADGFDFVQSAILSAPAPFPPAAGALAGTVSVIARSPERLTFEVDSPADGILVISENFYPGWQASVDGQPVDILRANLTLRAVPIRAGQHRIEMWYDPSSFRVGAAISLLTLAACVGGLIYLRGREAQQPAA
jgi:hypothetical protein